MEDFELTLFDRLEVIRKVLKDVPDEKVYISFSGGKDSTVLSAMIGEALPGNKIARTFCSTGIEYEAIVDFVKELQAKDSRFEIIRPNKNIRKMLEEKGYPFKSKLHSDYVYRYQKSGLRLKSIQKYLDNSKSGKFSCPKILKYQFSPDFNLKISQQCCAELKKKPFHQYQREMRRSP